MQTTITHRISPTTPPMSPLTIRSNGGSNQDKELFLGVGEAMFTNSPANPMTRVNTLIAANWSHGHGSIEGIGGPAEVGLSQFVFGYFRVVRLRKAIYCRYGFSKNANRLQIEVVVIARMLSIKLVALESHRLRDQSSYMVRMSIFRPSERSVFIFI